LGETVFIPRSVDAVVSQILQLADIISSICIDVEDARTRR
jgi:hypothetical protein